MDSCSKLDSDDSSNKIMLQEEPNESNLYVNKKPTVNDCDYYEEILRENEMMDESGNKIFDDNHNENPIWIEVQQEKSNEYPNHYFDFDDRILKEMIE